tara:strand:- start:234 stop:1178 length:945 start_codon:yes stop_codon:yes gene_type:complete
MYTHRETLLPGVKLFFKFNPPSWLYSISRAINSTFYSLPLIGIGSSLNRYENSFSLYPSSFDRDLYKNLPNSHSAQFLNLGSGSFSHPMWLNLDYPSQSKLYQHVQGSPGKDYLPVDLSCRDLVLPFKSSSVQLIYCSHVLDHLEDYMIENIFREVKRLLSPSGVFRIVVPNHRLSFWHLKCNTQYLSTAALDEQSIQELIVYTASHLFSDLASSSAQVLFNYFKESDFSINHFEEFVKRDYPQSFFQFNPKAPNRVITNIDFKRLGLLCESIGLSVLGFPFANVSSVPPFRNQFLFDNTESHYSSYYDIVNCL